MSYTIAISGKGGVGKTTLAGLIVSRLIAGGRRPVLAVDADPNACLDEVLGTPCAKSIGSIREETKQIAGEGMKTGVSKQQLLEMKIAESLVEADDFDLISMGRPEGPGCYCYANNVLKQAIGQISKNYPYVVLDNEAGMENLSRRIVTQVDLLIIVADPSKRGLDTCKRLFDLAGEMDIKFSRLALVINRLRKNELPAQCKTLQAQTGADIVTGLEENAELAELAERGGNIFDIPSTNAAVEKIDELLAKAFDFSNSTSFCKN